MSLKQGYKGRLSLKMGGSFPFYFKNNFRVDENRYTDANIKNASLDYITREGTPSNKLWQDYWSCPIVILNEENARLMRNSKRLMDTSKSKVLYSKQINLGKKPKRIDVDFSDLGKNFVIQLINKDTENNSLIAYIEGEVKNGKLTWNNEIKSNFYGNVKKSEVIKELNNAFNYAQEYYSSK